MDSWVEDQLIGSFMDAYEQGESDIGCIIPLSALAHGMQKVIDPSFSKKQSKKPKRRKLTKSEKVEKQIKEFFGKERAVISTPESVRKVKDPVLKRFEMEDRPTDVWFLEWLGVEPVEVPQAYEDQWFIDWLQGK